MLRIPLFNDGSFLLLAPRWSGWGDAAQAAALIALLLGPLLLIASLYRYEIKLVPRGAAALLLSLRGLGLLLLWGLAGLQPTIARVEHEDSPSRVLVAVDLSGSMNLADPQQTWPEKLLLAKALRLASDTQLERWLQAADQQTPPREPGLDAVAKTVDQLSRKDIARRLLDDDELQVLGRLKAQHHVELVGFHQAVADAAASSVAALFRSADKSEPPASTDLNLPLQRGLQPAAQQTGKLLGVVVVTDGRHNQGPPPLEQAQELARRQIPIFPVAIGSKQPPVDLAVMDVQAPRQVFKDADATVEAKLRAAGLPAQDIMVELTGSGSFKKQQKTIAHDGSNRVYTASFPIKLDEVGAQRLEIRVAARDGTIRETTTDNNRLATVIRVAPEKARILIVDDEPRWEYHYLASALGRDRDLTLDQVVFNPPRLGTENDAKLDKLGYARRQLPRTEGAVEDPLWSYDCIVVGDVAPEQLPAMDRVRLERYVADRGGTLVISAGKRHMPMAYFAGAAPDSLAADPLIKLLPLTQPSILQPKDGFAFAVLDAGAQTPFFQIDKDVDSSRERWLEMPRHFWGVAGVAKPGAQTLARADSPALPKPKDAATDPAGLVLQQPYGFGKVLYVGIDSTWRWRYRVGDLYHHRFWGQLMRWAAGDPWLPEGNRFVRFGARAPIYRHDQEVEIAVRLGEGAPSIAAATARMKLLRTEGDKEEPAATVPLVQDEQRPKQWTGKLNQLPPGHYRLAPDIPELRAKLADAPGDNAAARHGFTVLPPDDPELIDTATNWDLLRALAEQSRGRLFTAEDIDQLPDLLARQVERKDTRHEQRVWQDAPLVWWTLGILLSLLTAEWIVRKLAGLP
ncbi:MAG: hypothetical protein L0Y71_20830 [Gemmataceae bacterium]|nr:hypothetical protein [Gemmataceae bacterium]